MAVPTGTHSTCPVIRGPALSRTPLDAIRDLFPGRLQACLTAVRPRDDEPAEVLSATALLSGHRNGEVGPTSILRNASAVLRHRRERNDLEVVQEVVPGLVVIAARRAR